jgi:hypothetical protein
MSFEWMEVVQVLLTCGVVFYLGRMDQKLRFLCSRDRDHENRLRKLEQPDPNESALLLPVPRLTSEAGP